MRKGVRASKPGSGRPAGGDVQPGVPAGASGGDAAASAVGEASGRVAASCVVLLRTADRRWDYRVVGADNSVLLANEGLEDVWCALEEIARYWPGD
jgi:hypothetical protein